MRNIRINVVFETEIEEYIDEIPEHIDRTASKWSDF